MCDVQPILHQQNAFKVFCLYLLGVRGTLTLPGPAGIGFFSEILRVFYLYLSSNYGTLTLPVWQVQVFISVNSENIRKFSKKFDSFQKLALKFANYLFVNKIIF